VAILQVANAAVDNSVLRAVRTVRLESLTGIFSEDLILDDAFLTVKAFRDGTAQMGQGNFDVPLRSRLRALQRNCFHLT
jgi:hypothetical protein